MFQFIIHDIVWDTPDSSNLPEAVLIFSTSYEEACSEGDDFLMDYFRHGSKSYNVTPADEYHWTDTVVDCSGAEVVR